MRRIEYILVVLAVSCVCQARVITVDDDGPADFATIQAAIDDANNSDVVIVAEGTYRGLGNRDIDFKGKAITVRSKDPNDPGVVERTVIDCQGTEKDPHRGFYFHRYEGPDSVLEGLTIKNGYAREEEIPFTGIPWPLFVYDGGAIWCLRASPTISKCLLVGNFSLLDGGAIAVVDAQPHIVGCRITGNTAWGFGSGIAFVEVTSGKPIIPEVRGCLISENKADGAGAVACVAPLGGDITRIKPLIENCKIVGNSEGLAGLFDCDGVIRDCIIASNYWGGLSSCDGTIINCTIWGNSGKGAGQCQAKITNCIIWGNGDDLFMSSASYSCIEDNDTGIGNIHVDPCFVGPDKGDFHVKSQAGRWDHDTESWVKDNVTSPCIDGGDPDSPIGLEPFPNGGRINMGAYGGTAEASKSYFGGPVCETIIAGDINGDCVIDVRDFVILAAHWLQEY